MTATTRTEGVQCALHAGKHPTVSAGTVVGKQGGRMCDCVCEVCVHVYWCSRVRVCVAGILPSLMPVLAAFAGALQVARIVRKSQEML